MDQSICEGRLQRRLQSRVPGNPDFFSLGLFLFGLHLPTTTFMSLLVSERKVGSCFCQAQEEVETPEGLESQN